MSDETCEPASVDCLTSRPAVDDPAAEAQYATRAPSAMPHANKGRATELHGTSTSVTNLRDEPI